MVPLDHLQIVGNGQVVAEVPLSADRTAADAALSLRVERSGWYVLRAFATGPRHPVLDVYPFATTSPVYVSVGGAPVRSPADAAYFLAWVDRVSEAAARSTDWNDAAEKEAVLGHIAAARAVFAERARP